MLAGVCDYCTFGLALEAFGQAAAGWALLFQVLSWFNFYCLVRPYSNSAEAVLATGALFYWAPVLLSSATAVGDTAGREEKNGGRGGRQSNNDVPRETLALLLAAVCIAVRPTSAALWVRGRTRNAVLKQFFGCTVRLVCKERLEDRNRPRFFATYKLG